ncbi:PHB depolymerase family esterase [Actinoplanes sp. NPDC051851]|uniref:extracellular catalytic domain type 1 short-chain-length polyhydroxyalkanoate depolymerase n=1 Tax=Actinoplanes sp. NPDC051851 TaxID=3154753 RepID=UPI00342E0F7E
MRCRGIAAVLLTVVVLTAGCTRFTRPDPVPSASAAVGVSSHTMRVGTLDRTYRIYRPASLREGAPMVVVLHGAVGSGRQAEQSYGFDALADRDGFLVVYPDGVGRTWNVSTDCCGAAARDQVDDVGFIKQLVTAEIGDAGIDPSKVYAAGISNGAMLAYRLACETTLFAAIAPVSGTMINACPSPAPVSIIHIHGTADRTIPYGGGPGKRDNEGDGRLPVKIDGPPVPDLITTWRKTDDCAAPASTVSGVVTTSVARCAGGRVVELITVDGAGHQWPGAPGPGKLASSLLNLDQPSTALDATTTIWSFFASL